MHTRTTHRGATTHGGGSGAKTDHSLNLPRGVGVRKGQGGADDLNAFRPCGSFESAVERGQFDPSLYRSHAARWHFPQENATFLELRTLACGSKML
jgi:hypothetical protein